MTSLPTLWNSGRLLPAWLALTFGACSEMIRLREHRLPARDQGLQQTLGLGAIFTLLFACIALEADPSFLRVGTPGHLAGFVLLGLATGLRWKARRDLGASFRYAVVLKENQPLVTTGLYRFVRHPAYLGAHLFLAAVPLCCGSLLGILASLVAFPSTRQRISTEETMLETAFGAKYRAWKQRTGSLLPRITPRS